MEEEEAPPDTTTPGRPLSVTLVQACLLRASSSRCSEYQVFVLRFSFITLAPLPRPPVTRSSRPPGPPATVTAQCSATPAGICS